MARKQLTNASYINIPSGIDPDKKAPCALRYNQKVYEYRNGAKQIRLYAVPLKKSLLETRKRKKKNRIDKFEREIIMDNPFTTEEEKEAEIRAEEAKTIDKEGSLKRSKNRTISTIYSLARSNYWEYFFTLTLDPKKIDRTNYDQITDALKRWLNNLRHNYSKELKYLLIPELHKDGKSYHFHGLMSCMGNLTLMDSGKRFRNKFGEMVEIYNLKEYNLGYSNFQKICRPERVIKYITKYISKELCATTEGKKRYWTSKNLNRPKISVDLVDLTDDYIKSLLDCSTYIKSVEIERTKQIITYLEIPEDDVI